MLQVPTPPPPPLPPEVSTIVVGHGGPNIPELLIALVCIVAAVIVLRPLVRALARRLEGGALGDAAELRGELDELRARLAEVEGEQQRFAELEERLDFAERLLAQQREPARLEEGHR